MWVQRQSTSCGMPAEKKSKLSRCKLLLRLLYYWISQVSDPIRTFRAVSGFARYLKDWHTYSRLPGAEPIHLAETYPQVHDCTNNHPIDAHYFYANGWAMRRIVALSPRFHVDVASQTIFANLLGGVIPVVCVDYRPLEARLPGLQSMAGSLLALPFANCSVSSLSCLHVIEHIGLGRYGDPLDPQGTRKAAQELARVSAPGGNLFLATPVGRPRLCFNAHRIYTAAAICAMLSEFELVEFSGIHDNGDYVENVEISAFKDSLYACGLFWFKRLQS